MEPKNLSSTARYQKVTGKTLPRRARHRVYDRIGEAVHVANAQRQAHRCGSREDRMRHGQGEVDHREDGRDADSSGRPDPVAASQLQPGREEIGQGVDRWSSRLAGRRSRATRLLRRGGGRADQRRREGSFDPQRNQPGRYRRDALSRGHSDQYRRYDQPRGGRRSGLGPLLCCWCRRSRNQRKGSPV